MNFYRYRYRCPEEASQAIRENIDALNSNPLRAFGLAIAILERSTTPADEKYKQIKRMIESWCAGKPLHIGVMADEIEKTNPEMVSRDPESGYLMVDYGMLLSRDHNA
jgi:hypothetical protein